MVPVKNCLRLEQETSTPRHCLLGAKQALQLLDYLFTGVDPGFSEGGWGGGGLTVMRGAWLYVAVVRVPLKLLLNVCS